MSNRFKAKFNIKKGDTVVVISGDDKDLKKPRTVLEVFPEKGKFNAEERLKKIKDIGGRLVTVYLVKGKDNKIKTKYTGRVDLRSIDDGKLSLDTRTKVLVVTVDQGSGRMISYFPLTYDENYRIYFTDCLSQ